jgi:hypothetical protein
MVKSTRGHGKNLQLARFPTSPVQFVLFFYPGTTCLIRIKNNIFFEQKVQKVYNLKFKFPADARCLVV